MEMQPSTIDKLALIHVKDRKVLFARSKGKSVFYTPGGKREDGESDEQALRREIKEEISVDIIPGTLKFAKVFTSQAYAKPEGTMVKITCYCADFKGEIKPASEIEEVRFMSYSDMDKMTETGKQILVWLKESAKID